MKNTVVINCDNNYSVDCMEMLGNSGNSIWIEAHSKRNLHFFIDSIEIITEYTGNIYAFKIPNSYHEKNGEFTLHIKMNDVIEKSFLFKCKDINVNGNLIVRNQDYYFDVTYTVENTTNVPIATTLSLGVVKGGDNVKIRSNGTMYADGITTESISNAEIDIICT